MGEGRLRSQARREVLIDVAVVIPAVAGANGEAALAGGFPGEADAGAEVIVVGVDERAGELAAEGARFGRGDGGYGG